MIHSGRKPKKNEPSNPPLSTENTRTAKLVAILGILIFTVFFCSSARSEVTIKSSFGDGAYPVFAQTSVAPVSQTNTGVTEDNSIWSYLESVIEQFIRGNK